MGRLISKLIPPWAPWALAGVLLVALAGGGYLLKRSWQAEALAAQQIKQFEADRKLSAEAIAIRDARLVQVEALASAAKQRIATAPVTTTCGPVMRGVADSVRQQLQR